MSYYGPFIQNQTLVSTRQLVMTKSQQRYRQKLPYVDRLPYLGIWKKTVIVPNPYGLDTGFSVGADPTFRDQALLNEAYAKFQEEAYTTVNLAVDFAERKQTVDMLAKRASQILRFSKALKSLRFGEAFRELGFRVDAERRTRRGSKLTVSKDGVSREVLLKKRASSFGSNYLETHFGWEPLVKDVHDAAEVLIQSHFKGLRKSIKVGKSFTGRSPFVKPTLNLYSYGTSSRVDKLAYRLVGDVRIDNPNLLLLNQLGLLNPAVIIWETVPFSFVVDWFVNLGQVLSALTDRIGLSITNASTTYHVVESTQEYYNGGTTVPYLIKTRGKTERTLGIAAPKIALRQLKLPSVTRGLTAVSLLTQFLGKQR